MLVVTIKSSPFLELANQKRTLFHFTFLKIFISSFIIMRLQYFWIVLGIGNIFLSARNIDISMVGWIGKLSKRARDLIQVINKVLHLP